MYSVDVSLLPLYQPRFCGERVFSAPKVVEGYAADDRSGFVVRYVRHAGEDVLESQARSYRVIGAKVKKSPDFVFVMYIAHFFSRNVRKYYQLATQTAKKPPRINHLNSRIDKLHAYLRKFKDLNVRILVSEAGGLRTTSFTEPSNFSTRRLTTLYEY